MKLFGYEIAKTRRQPVTIEGRASRRGFIAAAVGTFIAKAMQPVYQGWAGAWGVIRESFAGAWQKNIELAAPKDMLAFGAVYACVRLISFDISKLRIKLVKLVDGVWLEQTDSPFLKILRKPNHYQTSIQFLMQWVVCKLVHGNAYILKSRDDRFMVNALYVLDPKLVVPLVTEEGDVYYELKKDSLSRLTGERVVIPASEIIHDRMLTVWHPLVGIPPLYACAASTTQGISIQANSAKFFANQSMPGGMLTAPNNIAPDTAKRLKDSFEANFGGANIGRLLVAGDGLEFKGFGMIAAVDAQLLEQLNFTGQDVARAFGVPPHKIGLGDPPTFNNIGALNQDYYSQTLQQLIESIELLLDEGLGLLNAGYACEMDLEGLLRLDPLTRADIGAKEMSAGMIAPNELRQRENLPPKLGGDTPYMQQQMVPLQILREGPKPAAGPAPAPPAPKPEPDEAKQLADLLVSKFLEAA